MSCMKASGRVTVDAVTDVGNSATDIIGNTVAAVTAATVAPPMRGTRRALLASLQPLLLRSLAVVPLSCGAVYAIQLALVHAASCSPDTAWVGVWAQKMIPTVAIGVACGVLIVIRGWQWM